MALNKKSDVEYRMKVLAGDLIEAIDGHDVFQRDPETGERQMHVPVSVDDLCRRILVEYQHWSLAD